MPSLLVAGVVIRYTCHVVWLLVVGMIGLSVMSLWQVVPKPIDAPPAFHIAAAEFAGKPVSGMS